MTTLNNLERKLKGLAMNIPKISVSRVSNGLDIDLDLEEGFSGYEHVNINPSHEVYNISYFGIFSQAFGTFLDGRFNSKISESKTLEDFRDKVRYRKESGDVERYDPIKDDIYSQLINLTKENINYDEVEKIALFFLEVFKYKAQRGFPA